MDFKRPRQLYLLLTIVFIFILFSSFTFFSRLEGFQKKPEAAAVTKVVEKPVIEVNTVIQKEANYQDGHSMVSRVPTTKDLIGLDYEGLLAKFPPEEGWEIDDSVPNFLTVSKEINEICPLHQNFFHLGKYDGRLSVYKGPLGLNEEAYLIETLTILIDELPTDIKNQLDQAETYKEQSLDVQQTLESDIQFNNEEELENKLHSLLEDLES